MFKNILFLANKISLRSHSPLSRMMMGIAVGTVALGVTIMLLTVAVNRGFNKQISGKMFDLWGHVFVSGVNFSETFESKPIALDDVVLNRMEDVEKDIGTEVSLVEPVIQYGGILQSKSQIEGVLFRGMGEGYFRQVLRQHIRKGSLDSMGHRDIVLSETTCKRLEATAGDYVILHFVRDGSFVSRKYRLCAIFKTGLIEFDEAVAFMRLSDLQSSLGWSAKEITGYSLWIDNIEDTDKVYEHLETNVLPVSLFAITIRDKYPALFNWLQVIHANERLVVVFFLGVLLINMITVLLVLIMEKISFVGIAKAMGIKDVPLQAIFMIVGLRILGFGLLIGNLLGLGLGYLQHRFRFIKLDEENYFLSYAPIEFPMLQVLVLNLIILTVGVIVLFIPSLVVRKFQPTQILRIH